MEPVVHIPISRRGKAQAVHSGIELEKNLKSVARVLSEALKQFNLFLAMDH
jgi:hypothetical protein